jgi:outer membrane protein
MSEENKNNETNPPKNETIPAKSKLPNATIINVVLFVGLLVLYVLNFYPTGKADSSVTDAEAEEFAELADRIADGAFNIAYVQSDSLMANYKLAQRLRSDFEAEQRRLEADLQRQQRSFQEDVESFQRQVQLNILSGQNAQNKEQELMLRQQELIQLNDTYTNRLMAREMDINKELYKRITDKLDSLNKEMNYDYILGFSQGGGILHANKRHDITALVLRLLNQEYEAGN